MQSPFPGMDPYLQQYWGDVHTSLMVYIRDQLMDKLPNDLQAQIEESLSVEEADESRTIYPDVGVIEQSRDSGSVAVAVEPVTVAEPRLIPVPNEVPADRRVEIVDLASGNRVVTVIEVLSPGNKSGRLRRDEDLRKQKVYLRGGVNLVEIDLIRGGDFVAAVPEELITEDDRTPYVICTRRASRRDLAEVVGVGLRD